MDRPEIRVDPVPPPPIPFECMRVPRERITIEDIETHGGTLAMPSKMGRDNKRTRVNDAVDLMQALKQLHKERNVLTVEVDAIHKHCQEVLGERLKDEDRQ